MPLLHSTQPTALVRAPALSRRVIVSALLAVLAAAGLALASLSMHSAVPAQPITAGTLVHFRGLGVPPATATAVSTPSIAQISLARAEHSYGLVP